MHVPSARRPWPEGSCKRVSWPQPPRSVAGWCRPPEPGTRHRVPGPRARAQSRRVQERRRRLEVDHVEQVVRRGVASGERREVPLDLDRCGAPRCGRRRCGRRGSRRAYGLTTPAGTRNPRRSKDPGHVAGREDRSDVVGDHRRRRRHVVVVPAVLVVVPDEQCLRPLGAGGHRVHHLGEEHVAVLDVLGVLLGGHVEVGIDQGERRELPRPTVRIEVRDVGEARLVRRLRWRARGTTTRRAGSSSSSSRRCRGGRGSRRWSRWAEARSYTCRPPARARCRPSGTGGSGRSGRGPSRSSGRRWGRSQRASW